MASEEEYFYFDKGDHVYVKGAGFGIIKHCHNDDTGHWYLVNINKTGDSIMYHEYDISEYLSGMDKLVERYA